MLRRFSRHGPIGLDIGAAGVKLLQFSQAPGPPVILAAAHVAIDVEVRESATREAAVCRAIEEALRRHSFRGREVVSALGVGEFQMKSIRLPKMPAEELASAIEFEAQDRFDVGGRTAQFRHLSAGDVRHGNELKEEIIVFAARDDVVQSRLALLESLRLRPIALDIVPCALARGFARFLRRTEDAQAVNVFVDVGWQATQIVINRGAEVSFVKLVEIGGRQFTDAVARALGLDIPQAADLRTRIIREAAGRRAGDEPSVSQDILAAVADAQRPLVEQLQKDVQLCLRYFAVTFRGRRPESITFTGGEAYEPSLIRSIAENCDIPCLTGHPLRGTMCAEPQSALQARAYQPAWAVACGLALRGSRWVGGPATESIAESRPAATA